MLSYQIYKLLHLVGVLMVFLSLGGLILYAVNGSDRIQPWRKRLFLTHGFGIFLVVLAGFGMLARMGMSWPWPGWIASKLVIWVVFAALPTVIVRMPSWAKSLWWLVILLGGSATYLAGQKPF